jgi:hypothetical protein
MTSKKSKIQILLIAVFSLLFINMLSAQIIPIADAIVDADSNGIPDRRGTYVQITGIVTVPSGVFSHTQLDIYVQDNTAGVNVFNYSITPIALGDSVIVNGQVYFYRGKTEISYATVTIIANNCPVPEPLPITCAMMNREPYEGRLVKICGVTTTAFLLTGDANFILIDSTGTCTMRIDADAGIAGLVMVQDTFTVVGIKSQYTSDTFPPVNSGYEFFPRFRSDFSKTLNNSLPLLTISEVQRPGGDGYSSYYEGQFVKVHGRITGPSYIFTSGSSKSLYIQDATNGVNVYAPTYDVATSNWLDSCGTEWECIGRVTEYNGLTEVANGVMTLLDTTMIPVTSRELAFNTAVTEGMESKLIIVSGPVIIEPGAMGGGMNFTIKNGTPGITIRVVDGAGIPTTWVKKNVRIRVTGIVGQYTSTAPFSTGYQVMPRFGYELVNLTESMPASQALCIDSVFPNPFSPNNPDPLLQYAKIVVNSPVDYRLYLDVYDTEGRLVKNLLNNQPGGYYELNWDGRDDNQEPCPIGIYILNLKAITAQGKDIAVRKPVVVATKL